MPMLQGIFDKMLNAVPVQKDETKKDDDKKDDDKNKKENDDTANADKPDAPVDPGNAEGGEEDALISRNGASAQSSVRNRKNSGRK